MPIKAPQVPVRWPQRQRSVFLYICVAWLSHSHLRHIHMKLWLQRVMKVGQLSNIVPCAYSVGILEVSKSQNEYWKMMYSQIALSSSSWEIKADPVRPHKSQYWDAEKASCYLTIKPFLTDWQKPSRPDFWRSLRMMTMEQKCPNNVPRNKGSKW